jgi:hypothetical protein
MQPAGTNLARSPSKLLVTVILGLVASALAASVLYAVHVSRAPSSSEFLTDLAPQGDGLSAEERRGLTREMLKARRENPQEPAEVRPTPASRSTDSGPAGNPADDGKATEPKSAGNPVDDGKAAEPKSAGNPVDDGKAAEPKGAVKAATDRTSPDRAAPLPIARPAPPRARAEAPVVPAPATPSVAATASSAPPPVGTPPGTTDPASQATATTNASSGTEPAPETRGFANKVLSSLSTLAGSAANATGNTVNWVIDLPGKAISAGGRLFGGDSSATTQPTGPAPSTGGAPSAATLPPPATAPPASAPPPRRNL